MQGQRVVPKLAALIVATSWWWVGCATQFVDDKIVAVRFATVWECRSEATYADATSQSTTHNVTTFNDQSRVAEDRPKWSRSVVRELEKSKYKVYRVDSNIISTTLGTRVA